MQITVFLHFMLWDGQTQAHCQKCPGGFDGLDAIDIGSIYEVSDGEESCDYIVVEHPQERRLSLTELEKHIVLVPRHRWQH